MLVLSRRKDESIVFPNLGIQVKILKVDGKRARIGVTAPQDVRILREEIETDFEALEQSFLTSTPQGISSHEIRNRLNTVNLAVHLYQQQMSNGQLDAANLTFLQLVDDLESIDRAMGGETLKPVPTESQAFHLLLVEDDVRQRQLLAHYLENRGCRVATANDCAEAVDYLQTSEQPDFVLLDLRLPDTNGAEAVRRIRETSLRRVGDNPVEIIAVSGTSPDELGIVTGHKGVDNWFPKPTNPESLLNHMSGRAQRFSTSL
ncbi:UNVERIFIED_CONTAM: hypothetical protein GTU68_013971 [Idotea baltica]|nr:hypothetical protein [Idotea baltica]